MFQINLKMKYETYFVPKLNVTPMRPGNVRRMQPAGVERGTHFIIFWLGVHRYNLRRINQTLGLCMVFRAIEATRYLNK